jgi:hypothetical protein
MRSGRKKLRVSNPKAGEVEVGKATVDRIVGKPTFEYFDKPTVGVEFFLFTDKGDSIEGVVISRSIANVRRNSSYAIQLDNGKIVEVFANKTLHRQLKECLFQRVRIVYIGREQTTWGHAKKIYRVYKQPHGSRAATSLQKLREKYDKKGVEKHG